jgi:hypothetical protein
MRQAITLFAGSIGPEGIPHSRFPSHTPQLIAGFALFWVLQIADHHLYFGDTPFANSLLPRIDGVFDFFSKHIDPHTGLVAGLPDDVWQYVDWVTTWGATDAHPDKGVPTAGRKSNCHTFFSMLYAYTLGQAAQLARAVGRPHLADEWDACISPVVRGIRAHCFDGRYFTDSTVDACAGQEDVHSQHCQVFAVLSGAARAGPGSVADPKKLLSEAFAPDSTLSKCSYVMKFYALRAMALAGDDVYEAYWPRAWDPWRHMLRNNLSTWEEDDVRQRSDCHAWGSVPVYEYCTEVAGVRPVAAGCGKVLFRPRLRLTESLEAKVALGRENVAMVRWVTGESGEVKVSLELEKEVEVVTQLPGLEVVEHGVVGKVELVWRKD